LTTGDSISISDQVGWLTDAQSDQIVQVLHQLIGVVALGLLVDAIQNSTSLPGLLRKLEKHLPEAIQPVFSEQTSWLHSIRFMKYSLG
jgi:hypothetical protein